MTPDARRAKIMSLLSQCRIDETERLHSGRATVPAQPIAFYAEKIEELFADDTPPLLDRLWASSTGLLKRFEAHPSDRQSLDRMMCEVVEFISAVQTLGKGSIAREAADVWVTVINVLNATGVTEEQFGTAIEDVMASNDKKDHTTHRRSQQQGVERLERETQS